MNKGKKIQFGKISADFAKKASAVEIIGSITKLDSGTSVAIQNEALDDDKEHVEMKEVMGITSFGKKAKTFDIKVIISFFCSFSLLIFSIFLGNDATGNKNCKRNHKT